MAKSNGTIGNGLEENVPVSAEALAGDGANGTIESPEISSAE